MTAHKERQERIFGLLQDFQGERPLKTLVWQELEYDRVDRSLSTRGVSQDVEEALFEAPVLLAEAGEDGGFQVISVRLRHDRLSRAQERAVVNWLLRSHPYALFVFSNRKQTRWHFVNAHTTESEASHGSRRTLRRISVRPSDRLRTAAERLAQIALGRFEERTGKSPRECTPLEIRSYHDRAFSVEAVTRSFYEDYLAVFEDLKADMRSQSGDERWAHKYALLFLSRCMFIRFVQKKGWLGGDTQFMDTFWHAYLDAGQQEGEDDFFPRWLSVLFFEVFNSPGLSEEHAYFPADIRRALRNAPYLNGGLFRPGDLDEDRRSYGAKITDERYRRIFSFLEQYNFTIAEDRPLDQEVAVDPEMIGKVYESLVNVSSDADKRGEAGIFYTPRTEIDLMCRLSLADYLTSHLGEGHRDTVEAIVFALEPDEKQQADKKASSKRLWTQIRSLLKEVAVVDPACGAGSFLVGMLHVLDDLLRRANETLGINESAYDRRKRIIGRSLYGVDVMEWAASVAELRLWLSLLVHVDRSPDQLHRRTEPLLPNVSSKIRSGDALVQEVGGINLGLRSDRRKHDLSSEVHAEVQSFKTEKRKYVRNDPTAKYSGPDELRDAEVELFRHILRDGLSELESEIERLERRISEPQARQMRLDGSTAPEDSRGHLREEEWKEEKEKLKSQATQIQETLGALHPDDSIPFVWDIAFIEVFSGERQGFDVVIGNPPYVRQENIADPIIPSGEITHEDKKEYKENLAQTVYQAFPNYFGVNAATGEPEIQVDKKSDLYIYFYYYGLRLLNESGTFCFITSNTWLDVNYGKELKEFLLHHVHVKYVIDNQRKRSFTDADVNTVVTLFSAPDDSESWALSEKTRFVMLNTSFDKALSGRFWADVRRVEHRDSNPQRRVFTATQAELLKRGSSAPQEIENGQPETLHSLSQNATYEGDKWRGKYLKAPDVYWKILERASDKLCRLGDVATVRRGYTTGANTFFYLDREDVEEWQIENRFLAPLLKSPRETNKQLVLQECDFKYQVFDCDRSKEKLKGTQALEYIRWGETQGFHERRTLAERSRWWSLRSHGPPPIISPCSISDLYRAHVNECGVRVDKRLYEVRPADDWSTGALALSLNSTLTSLFLELLTRTGLGEGLLDMTVYELEDCPIVHPENVGGARLKDRRIKTYKKEINAEERIETDEVALGALGLTASEQQEVRDAVETLVDRRRAKARSV